MTRFASWLLLITLCSAFGAVAYHAVRLRIDAGMGMPEYSVYSKERNGLATAAGFLRNAGWEPVALTRPIQQTRYRGLLVLVQPQGHEVLPGPGTDLSEPDARGLLRWVEQGNTLLACGRGMGTLYEQLGIRLRRSGVVGRDESTTRAEPGEAGGYTDQINQVFVEGHDTLQTDLGLP